MNLYDRVKKAVKDIEEVNDVNDIAVEIHQLLEDVLNFMDIAK